LRKAKVNQIPFGSDFRAATRSGTFQELPQIVTETTGTSPFVPRNQLEIQ
jgi:hypothetical protein